MRTTTFGVFSDMRLSFVLLLALTLDGAATAAEWSVPALSPDQVLKALKPGHPRLLSTGEEWDRLRRNLSSDAVLTTWDKALVEEADKLLAKPVETYRIPDGKRLLFVSRSVLDRVYTLAYAHRMRGGAKYRDRLWRELDAVCAFKDWNPSHFLDTAEMTHAVAVGYDWLHADWTPEQRARLRGAIVTLGLTPAAGKRGTGWKTARHNWNQVCNGGIGIGALAVMEDEPALASGLVAEAVGSIQLALREYAPDGAWGEGPSYWHYATSYTVAFLAALETALGTEYRLSSAPGFDRTARFPIHLTGPSGRFFNFADCKDGGPGAHGPWFFWLARTFQDPLAAAHGEAHPGGHPLSLLWRVPPRVTAWDKIPTDAVFRHAEAAALRGRWGSEKALYVGLKAGDNGFNHSNLDLGSFVFEAGGERWIIDPGPDNYNLPGYFGGGRWTYYRMRAEGQNTLVLNPGSGPDQLPKAKALLGTLGQTTSGVRVKADLTSAYAPHAARVLRTWERIGDQEFQVRDEIAPTGSVDLWWFAHTKAAVEVAVDGRSALLTQNRLRLRVSLDDAPADFRFTVMDAKPLPSSPNPEGQADNAGIRKLTLHARLEKPAAWTVQFALDPENAARP